MRPLDRGCRNAKIHVYESYFVRYLRRTVQKIIELQKENQMTKFVSISLAVGLIFGGVLFGFRESRGELSCAFADKQSTATVKNNNAFQKTCSFECTFTTEGNEHLNKGAAGLKAGESFSQPATSKAKITAMKSKSTDCEK